MTLRGAGVEVDVRRAVRVAVRTSLIVVANLTAALLAAGARKNAEITELREHGVRVEVTVSKCLGVLGGSGSNKAGYACRGTYAVGGHRYVEAIPGAGFDAPGAKVPAVTARSDPGLISTASDVVSEHASWRVLALPSVPLFALALALALLAKRSRSARTGSVLQLRTRP